MLQGGIRCKPLSDRAVQSETPAPITGSVESPGRGREAPVADSPPARARAHARRARKSKRAVRRTRQAWHRWTGASTGQGAA